MVFIFVLLVLGVVLLILPLDKMKQERSLFVEQGTTHADNGFVCTNNKGGGVVGTDALVFSQFSGAGAIVAGDCF